MARKRSLDEGPVLRGQILAAAARLFYERGYAETSIRDIGVAVGISSSTMYHHFANKQDVLAAIILSFMQDFDAAIVPVLQDTARPVVDRLLEAVRLHIEMSDDRRPELLVGNPFRAALAPGPRAQTIALQRTYRDAFRAAIEEGCAAGVLVVDNPTLAAMAILDMVNGVREWFAPGGALSRGELIDRYQRMVAHMLGVAGSAPGHPKAGANSTVV